MTRVRAIASTVVLAAVLAAVATAGAAPIVGKTCSPSGRTARTAAGTAVKCVSGRWRRVHATTKATTTTTATTTDTWDGTWSGSYSLVITATCYASYCPKTSPAYCDPYATNCDRNKSDTCPPVTLTGRVSGILTQNGSSLTGRFTLADGTPHFGYPPPRYATGCEVAQRTNATWIISGTVTGESAKTSAYPAGHASSLFAFALTRRGDTLTATFSSGSIHASRG